MQEPTLAESSPPETTAKAAETHERFQRLRMLISDHRRRQLLLFVFSIVSLAIVSLMAFLAYQFPTLPFDLATTLELQEITNAPFLQLMIFVSAFGYMPWSAITLSAGVLLVGLLLGWKDGAYLLLLTVLQAVANQLIKAAVGRPRPLDTLVDVFVPVAGNSFPSGHVMFYTVFFGFLFFLAWTRVPHSFWRVLLLALAGGLVLLIGPSRMYLGAHWLTDVIAAHLLGLIILAFGIEFYLRYLAPYTPTQQAGLVGARDQASQSPK
ncbi:MAG: phosphatase PAP2 family protein [Roseiflexaceae bacterium]